MTAPPENLADRPGVQGLTEPPTLEGLDQPHDLLSELLRSVRLSGERIVAHAASPGSSLGFADVGCLHIVEEGGIVLRIDGDTQVRHLSRGDFVLLPRGDRHWVGGESARWLSGTFTIGDPQASHLLGSLPAVVVMSGASGPEGLQVARKMIMIEMESPSQGSAVMIARILDLIFIQILRAWAARPDAEPNWLAGAFDPQIGVALSAIHGDPARDWTVEKLARACNLSRSAFAARFAERVGKPPATYLAHMRLDAATDLLRDTILPVALIAKNVGYESEAAFSRAFKNRYGTPPTRWRQNSRHR
ncbi:AraC family transcriptional regulator [Actinomadura rupiterrae]|uniref:AraC family transcriptional regulator n=1 Tax=Actinomadura rupiterrae TaxID=559627 RepID=UPI0020A5CDB5|nr:AraC family transcriptional regulator [Actinomadura rupiterrae]